MFLVWVFRVVGCVLLLFVCVWTVVDQLPRLGKRELICLLLFTCNCVFFVWGGGGSSSSGCLGWATLFYCGTP